MKKIDIIIEEHLEHINKIYNNKKELKVYFQLLHKSYPHEFWVECLEYFKKEKNSINILKFIYDNYLKLKGLEIDDAEGQTKMTWQQKKAQWKKDHKYKR